MAVAHTTRSAHPTRDTVRPSRTRSSASEASGSRALLVITVLALITPISFEIGSLYMLPSRLLFLFTVPYLVVQTLRGAYGRLIFTDFAIAFHVLWMMITIAIHHPSQAVTFSASTALAVLGGYLTARATIRNVSDFQFFAKFYATVVILMFPLALTESLTTQIVLANWINALDLSGINTIRDVNYCCRLGLDRAQVAFVHPIHFGLFASGPVAIYFVGLRNQLNPFRRTVATLLIIATCFMSVSSGPFLTAIFQVMLIGYMIITHKYAGQWKLLLWMTAGMYAVIEVASDRFGLYALASRLAFNPGTATFRKLLFDIGSAQVARTPIFGWGFHRIPGMPNWMPSTLDNFWLAQAVSYGYPGFISVMAAFLYSMIRAGRGLLQKGSDLYNARVGWTILLVSLLLSLSTVTIWNQLHSVIFLLLGAGQFLFLTSEPDETRTADQTPDRPRSRYTRFAGERGKSANRSTPGDGQRVSRSR
ncbi:O-antigen ligase family protein [Qingshengfaniella alkalisoli]|uniref:O-antigen ligase domain-containing protein n=1 Tax=Qingshengfaniella alkalisoli TaxID=2599296 RepID=A0A5B8J9F6_9RHOB|nr:O-antigen ligase family protein [Qingshengfaniella alkalisoli]QDY70967.1 hypothetical protein FPZ52_14830 [Qingshengfaniella alkalisoli]